MWGSSAGEGSKVILITLFRLPRLVYTDVIKKTLYRYLSVYWAFLYLYECFMLNTFFILTKSIRMFCLSTVSKVTYLYYLVLSS